MRRIAVAALAALGTFLFASCDIPQEQQAWQTSNSHLHASWAVEEINNLHTLDEAVDGTGHGAVPQQPWHPHLSCAGLTTATFASGLTPTGLRAGISLRRSWL